MSSRHEGVSCDSCLKSNFRGRRYKCLICYDFDLCANCYEEGATNARHLTDHAVQCILTRADYELYYGGELQISDTPQSFTCPYCKKMGFSDSNLYDHVSFEHTDTGLEVVCPVCATLPGGDPNLVTDDFAGHLTLEHRSGSRDLISFLDEPSAIRHGGVRRIPHAGRAFGAPRSRRSNMHFSSANGLSALSPSAGGASTSNGGGSNNPVSTGTGTGNSIIRDSVDPIAELLSQLSGVRRGVPQPSQLQQLQMQIQLERAQLTAARQQLERIPRRPVLASSVTSMTAANAALGMINGNAPTIGNGGITIQHVGPSGISNIPSSTIISRSDVAITSTPVAISNSVNGTTSANTIGNSGNASVTNNTSVPQNQTLFLLNCFINPAYNESELHVIERQQAERSQFVQSLVLSSLSNLNITKRQITQKLESAEANAQESEELLISNMDEHGMRTIVAKHISDTHNSSATTSTLERTYDVFDSDKQTNVNVSKKLHDNTKDEMAIMKKDVEFQINTVTKLNESSQNIQRDCNSNGGSSSSSGSSSATSSKNHNLSTKQQSSGGETSATFNYECRNDIARRQLPTQSSSATSTTSSAQLNQKAHELKQTGKETSETR